MLITNSTRIFQLKSDMASKFEHVLSGKKDPKKNLIFQTVGKGK